jgi:hypothetical protein
MPSGSTRPGNGELIDAGRSPKPQHLPPSSDGKRTQSVSIQPHRSDPGEADVNNTTTLASSRDPQHTTLPIHKDPQGSIIAPKSTAKQMTIDANGMTVVNASTETPQLQVSAVKSENRNAQRTSINTAALPQLHMSTPTSGSSKYSQSSTPSAPLFERLVTEEVQEIKSYIRIIENQNRRLSELQHLHGDLERRLEVESRTRQQLEATLEGREREWSYRFAELRKERDEWKQVVKAEQAKNTALLEQIRRKDADIHRMLQRKVTPIIYVRDFAAVCAMCSFFVAATNLLFHYSTKQYDHDSNTSRSIRSVRTSSNDRTTGASGILAASDRFSQSPEPRLDSRKSPHEILAASGSADAVRRRNAKGLLYDFFGM